MESATSQKTYHIRNSPRCFRFKPEAFMNHAPQKRGIYELVTFDEARNPTILFIGAAFNATIHDCLIGHAEGTRSPKADDLLSRYPNLYFDYIEQMDAKTQEDAQDIVWWLIDKHRPPFNDAAATRPSGRTASINVVEQD